MKTLSYWKTNSGCREGSEVYAKYEGFDGCVIQKTESSVQIFNNQKMILDLTLSLIESDALSITYVAQDKNGNRVRICCMNPRMAAMFGDTITFASQHKDGFAVHYEIR